MFSSSDAAQTLYGTPGSSDAAAGSGEWFLEPQFTQQRKQRGERKRGKGLGAEGLGLGPGGF